MENNTKGTAFDADTTDSWDFKDPVSSLFDMSPQSKRHMRKSIGISLK